MTAEALHADRVRARFRWELLALLWVAYFLNQADRQIFGVTLPLIRDDLGLSDTQMGLVATTFMVVFGLLVPVAGVVSDRVARGGVVVASLFIFSAGTLLTGVASTYLLLLLFRGIATGGGEAFYSPAATSWIAEHHVRTRARALSFHHTANYTGVILGSLLAGWVADRYGWRWSFWLFGAAGLVWATVIWVRMRGAPRRVRSAAVITAPRATFGEAVRAIASEPLLVAQVIGFAGLIFLLTGYMTWMPTMLYERFGLSLAAAGFSAVAYHHLAAAAGLFSSVLTDRLVERHPRVRLFFMAGSLLLCAPFVWIAGATGEAVVLYLALAGFGLFRGVYDANLYAGIFDLVEDRLRSSVAGVVIAIAFVVGAFSPLVMGAMKARFGLAGGLQMTAIVAALIGASFLATVALARTRPARS